jgi:hypothetical protein
MNAEITKHAQARIKERLGLPRRALQRHVDMVLNKGERYKGNSRPLTCQGKDILTHGKFFYVFDGNCLVTVMPMRKDETIGDCDD